MEKQIKKPMAFKLEDTLKSKLQILAYQKGIGMSEYLRRLISNQKIKK